MSTRPNAKTSKRVSDDGEVSPITVKAGRQQQFAYAGQPLTGEEMSSIKIGAKILKLDHGLYALSVAEMGGFSGTHSGIVLPGVSISIRRPIGWAPPRSSPLPAFPRAGSVPKAERWW